MKPKTQKPTPKPWKTIPSPHGKEYLCVQIGRNKNYTTLELKPADARLIAAAPELLEAAKTILENNDGIRFRMVLADAIAKAEGKS